MRRAAIAALLLLALVPLPAQATPSASAKATPALPTLGDAVHLWFTKRTTSITDGQQTGTVRVEITGPTSIVLEARPYSLAQHLGGAYQKLEWTWQPTRAGIYTLVFNDTATTGAQTDTMLVDYQVLAPPQFVPKWPAPYTIHDGTGARVDRAWGDLVLANGTVNAASRNYLRVPNPDNGTATVIVAFLDALRNDPGLIGLAGNMHYTYTLGPTPGQATQLATSQDGSGTFEVPPGATLWVGYVVHNVPAGLRAGDYSAPFTVTFLPEETA